MADNASGDQVKQTGDDMAAFEDPRANFGVGFEEQYMAGGYPGKNEMLTAD